MPRKVKNTTRVRSNKIVSHDVVVRDDANAVIGRAKIIVEKDGDGWVELIQTYGGNREGTLAAPVRCDLDVLKQIVEDAEAIAALLT